MSGEFFCPGHGEVSTRIMRIEAKQGERPCASHESRLKNVEDNNKEQWEAINSLRRMVWMGAGATAILAFLGSILGAVLK